MKLKVRLGEENALSPRLWGQGAGLVVKSRGRLK